MSRSQVRIFKVISETPLSKFHDSTISKLPMLISRHFRDSSSSGGRRRPNGEGEFGEIDSLGSFNGRKSSNFYNDDSDRRRSYSGPQNPANRLPNRPMRGERGGRRADHQSGSEHFGRNMKSEPFSRRADVFSEEKDGEDRKVNWKEKPFSESGSFQFLKKEETLVEDGGNDSDEEFLGKFKLGGADKEKRDPVSPPTPSVEVKDDGKKMSATEDSAEIFKKMKETGLIPNAVAMLDGLCKDGLVQEAMKLFGLMREKGTIPEVVIYTAVVEGFCKAQKLDDAKRIFRKMQSNGISPNAYSYTVLIYGLFRWDNLEDAVEFTVEMLEAGHSPNVATLVGLVDKFSKAKGVEEARNVINRLREKGFFLDEKAVRDFLDKKGPSSPLVWDAIFGKKSSQKLF